MLTKTRIGNYLRRHMLGDQPTFRQGFKEGVEYAVKTAANQKRLTDAEILLINANLNPEAGELFNKLAFARAIEAKLREKNT